MELPTSVFIACYVPTFGDLEQRIAKVMILVFRTRCGTLNSNQSKDCDRIMELLLSHFNVFISGLSGWKGDIR